MERNYNVVTNRNIIHLNEKNFNKLVSNNLLADIYINVKFKECKIPEFMNNIMFINCTFINCEFNGNYNSNQYIETKWENCIFKCTFEADIFKGCKINNISNTKSEKIRFHYSKIENISLNNVKLKLIIESSYVSSLLLKASELQKLLIHNGTIINHFRKINSKIKSLYIKGAKYKNKEFADSYINYVTENVINEYEEYQLSLMEETAHFHQEQRYNKIESYLESKFPNYA